MLQHVRVPALLASLLLLLAAPPVRAQNADTVSLKVGVLSVVDVAALYLGIQKGFFREERLDVEPVTTRSGATIIPAVVTGDDQIGFSNFISLILATARGLPLQTIIAGSQAANGSAHEPGAVVVTAASPIHTYKDLEGKTIAVNSLNNLGDTTIRVVLDRHGVDITKVKFIEIPFPEMPPALKAGRVDAIWVNEPFQTIAANDGDRVLFKNYEEYDPKLTIAVYFTTKAYAAQHPDVVGRFARAMAKSMGYAAAHPADVRAILPSYTGLEPALAGSISINGWGTTINMASIERLQAAMVRFGQLPAPIDLKLLIPPSAIDGK
jgi:NitT/TauT family transport system substrate-binding protein